MDFRYPRYPLYQTASWREYDANGIGVGKCLIGSVQEAEDGVNLSLPYDWLDQDPSDGIDKDDLAQQCADTAWQDYVWNRTQCESDYCMDIIYREYTEHVAKCYEDLNVEMPDTLPKPQIPNWMPA
jgi:hypothetical protein